MNRNVPNLVIAMEVVDMMPPCRNAMVSLSHVEHLAGKFDKVGIFGELDLKAVIGRLPEESKILLEMSSDSALLL